MRELTLNLLDKIKFSFRWQKNIYFTVGLIAITAGANALTGNWIAMALGIISEQFFNKPLSNYDILFGILLLILGLYCIHLGLTVVKVMNHDRHKWEEFKTLADFEKARNILQQISTHFYYQSSQDTHLYCIQHFFEQPENRFLTASITKKGQALRDKLNSYLVFRGLNFFVYPSNQTQGDYTYGLQPSLDINKELQNYDQRKADRLEVIRDELIQKTREIEEAFSDIIITAKNKLGL